MKKITKYRIIEINNQWIIYYWIEQLRNFLWLKYRTKEFIYDPFFDTEFLLTYQTLKEAKQRIDKKQIWYTTKVITNN